jgi:hybrid cluster-associated redox disulfide protein
MSENSIPPITSDTILNELFETWPDTIQFFLARKMSCVGCSMVIFDTVSEAAANYGLPVAEFLAELRSTAVS